MYIFGLKVVIFFVCGFRDGCRSVGLADQFCILSYQILHQLVAEEDGQRATSSNAGSGAVGVAPSDTGTILDLEREGGGGGDRERGGGVEEELTEEVRKY